MQLHKILHKYYCYVMEFIIKVLNCHAITWTVHVIECNYMLKTEYIKFTRILHLDYIIYVSKLHADVMTYPPIS